MKKSLLLSATCALALLLAVPASASTIPVTLQQTLRTAAVQGPDPLKAAVYQAVQKYPGMAQAIVNEAARYQPGMGQSLADIANQALREQNSAAQTAQLRAASRAQNANVGAKSAAYSQTPSGLGAGGWVTLGLGTAAAGAAVALGVSGSGGDDPTPSELEYFANYGLSAIHANSAYVGGVTGSGVLVAVGDTGIDTDHPEFSGRIAGGYNALTTTVGIPGVEDDPAIGHGSFVSGIIVANKDNTGMHGVAYNAQLLPIKLGDSISFGTSAQMADGVNYAVSQGADVWNGSYGFPGVPDIAAIETELDAYANAISNGMILVFAAGNESYTEPDIPAGMPYVKPANDALGIYSNNANAKDYSATASQLLAVVSVNESGIISSFSNLCGIAADWCLAAPGENIYSTTFDGSYDTESGTSFAAPHVAGAAALLLEKYPSLTPAQVVTRILTTATKTGIYADTNTYGQGLLNMQTATAFIANPMLVTGPNLRSGAYTLQSSQFRLASPFGDGLQKSLSSMTFKPVDSFDGAAIETPASELVAADRHTNGFADSSRRFGRSSHTETFEGLMDGTVRWQQVPGNDRHDPQVEARITSSFASHTDVTVGYMDDPALGFGLTADGSVDTGDTLSEGAFLSPYLSFAQDGMNMVASTKVAGITVRAGSFTGHAEDDRTADAYGAATELVFAPYTGSSISVQAGFVSEDRTFLGTENSGAFRFGETSTTYAGLSARLPVAAGIELVGSYFLGSSAVNPAAGSLLLASNGITSDAFSLGVIKSGLVLPDDRFGLLVNQPLRVSGGQAGLSLPNGVSRDYVVSFSNVTADLAPTGREVDLEAFYRAPLDQQTDLNASIMYRHQPDHVATADDEVQTLVRWQRRY